jgi:hypothetical protein
MAAKDSSKRKGSHSDSAPSKKHKDEASESKSSSAQKREVRKERQSHRRHADTVSDAKVLWNKLRLKTNTTEETKELMERVMTLVRGKVNEISLQHDASRVVQAAVQFGSAEQRKEILLEICEEPGALIELSKIRYAHFLSLKLIKCCARDNSCVKLIVKVRRLLEQRSFRPFLFCLSNGFPNVVLRIVIQRKYSKTCCPCCRRSCSGVNFLESSIQGNCKFEARILWSSF